MAFEVTGILEVVYPEAQVTERFKKREFVLKIQDGGYEEFIKFQLTQDKCQLLNKYQIGDSVTVSFNLKGRPYTKNGETIYYSNLDAWRLATPANAPVSAPAASPATNAQAPTTVVPPASSSSDVAGMTFSEAGNDELPF